MTLTEARKTLEQYQSCRRYDGPLEQSPTMPEPKEIGEAIDVAIIALGGSGNNRPEIGTRFSEILGAIANAKGGYNPFLGRERLQKDILWRQVVWFKLRNEGYSIHQIGKATGYSHSAVFCGCRAFRDALEVNDYLASCVWDEFCQLKDKEQPKYYGD